jgi:hypothetical protein
VSDPNDIVNVLRAVAGLEDLVIAAEAADLIEELRDDLEKKDRLIGKIMMALEEQGYGG